MNNQQVLKEGSAQNTPQKQNLKRKDPRQDTEIDVISSDNEDKINRIFQFKCDTCRKRCDYRS